MEQTITNWIPTRCCICGQEFKYPKGGYNPKTCANPSCIRRYLHPELVKKGGDAS